MESLIKKKKKEWRGELNTDPTQIWLKSILKYPEDIFRSKIQILKSKKTKQTEKNT